MADGVAAVWVPVEDMGRAVRFYRDVLGLKVVSEQQDWSEIDADGLRIGLNAREDSAASGGGAVISFTPDGGIEAEVERLKGAGVALTGGISDHAWGRIAPFKDSEGNDLQMYSPPNGSRRSVPGADRQRPPARSPSKAGRRRRLWRPPERHEQSAPSGSEPGWTSSCSARAARPA